jgi:hypothetical protein
MGPIFKGHAVQEQHPRRAMTSTNQWRKTYISHARPVDKPRAADIGHTARCLVTTPTELSGLPFVNSDIGNCIKLVRIEKQKF